MLAALPAVAAPRSAAETEAALKAVQARIRSATEAVQDDVAKRDSVAAQLRDADRALAAARRRFDDVRARRAASEQRRAELAMSRTRAQRGLEAERGALAAQLRSAYMSGPQEQLRVLLNSGEPATVGRMLVYYEYLGRARTARLGEIREQVTRLEELDEALAAETARLADFEEERHREAAALDTARAARALALSGLQARIATHGTELKELRANAAALEDLLARLRAALAEFDSEELQGTPGRRRSFGELRGRLPWPAHGRLLARYGDARPGGLKWTGMLLGTRPAGEVRAAYYGRVIYADWLPGLGLLAILDHGGGYLSLYAHNDRIFKEIGDRVRPGEVIAASSAAAAGRPELYFEIRQGARPLDPRPWLRGMPKP